MILDGISAIAVIIILSFGIDRIVTGMLFLLSFVRAWEARFPAPSSDAPARGAKRYKLVYFTLAGVLAIVVLAMFGHVRIFEALGFAHMPEYLDIVMTGLILIGGADRMVATINFAGGLGGGAQSGPVEVTGKLVLEGDPRHGDGIPISSPSR